MCYQFNFIHYRSLSFVYYGGRRDAVAQRLTLNVKVVCLIPLQGNALCLLSRFINKTETLISDTQYTKLSRK